MKKTTVSSFIAQFKAVVNGDNASVKAEKAWRQANAAINSQIYTLKGKTVGLENEVDRKEESLASARVNGGQPIENDNYYVNNLISAKNNLALAEKELKKHNELVEFLEKELVALSKEVSTEEKE